MEVKSCLPKNGGLFLVVAPTSVIYHWQEKLAEFLPHVKVNLFHGLKRSLSDLKEEGILLTSYGILRLEKETLLKYSFEAAIYDEIQVAKNPGSRIHETLLDIPSKMRVGLTGTPIENNLRELKSLFDIVLPNYMPSEKRFKEEFMLPIEKEADPEKKELLSKITRPFILRRKKKEVLIELPEKSEDKLFADLSPEQEELYTECVSQFDTALLEDKAAAYIHVFSLISKLKQICNHPALLHKNPRDYKSHKSGKWDLFVEILSDALASDQKVVVFSQYLLMLDIIKEHLKGEKIDFAEIRGGTLDRQKEMKRFQEDPSCKVFVGSLQASGLGIDLTAASTVILYDRWWNAARENQAIDRVHRIGQKWGVQVYKLLSKGTIEEKIDLMITKKGALMEEIILAEDEKLIKKLTPKELIELLSYTGNS